MYYFQNPNMKTSQRRKPKNHVQTRSIQVQTDLAISCTMTVDESNETDQLCYLSRLPELIMLKIIMMLNVSSLLSLAATSKGVRIHMSLTRFGRSYVQRRFTSSYYLTAFLHRYSSLEPKMFSPNRERFWDIWYHNVHQISFACATGIIMTESLAELRFYSQRLHTALRKLWRGRLTYNWQTLHNLADRAVIAHARADMHKLRLDAVLLGKPFPYYSKYPVYVTGSYEIISGRDPQVQGPTTMRFIESQYRKYSPGKAGSNLTKSLFRIHPLVMRSYVSVCKVDRHQLILYCLSTGDFSRMFPRGLPDGSEIKLTGLI